MSKDELQWLLLTASAAPITNTNEARFKAAALLDLAGQLDAVVRPEEIPHE